MQSNLIVTVTDSTLNLLKTAVVFAKTAESRYLIRQKLAPENFAPTPAIRREVVRMIDKQYSSLVSYKSAMALAKTMYKRALLLLKNME